MQNKKVRLILIVIALFAVIILISQLVQVYALFQSELKGTANKRISNWTITVNNENISSGVVQNFIINTVNLSENDLVSSNKFAPGMEGDFIILIDPTGTEVSVRYDITLDKSKINNTNISISSVEEIANGNGLIKTGESTYTGLILLSDIQNDITNQVKISFKWELDGDNSQDIQIGTIYDYTLEVPIQVVVSQYTGEEIVAFGE